MSLCFCFNVFISMSNAILSASVTPGCSCGIFVERMPCRWCFMWPFCVSIDSGKCLLMAVVIIPGHDVRKPARVAARSVSFVGNPRAACRYVTTSALLGRVYMLSVRSWKAWVISSHCRSFVCVLTFVVSLVSGIRHSPVFLSLHPFHTGILVGCTSPSYTNTSSGVNTVW